MTTDPDTIAEALARYAGRLHRVGHEAGSLSPWLHDGLLELGVPVICLETRHARAAGLTSKRWQSGTSIDVKGRISKAGDPDVRRALYEAASAMLTRFKGRDIIKTGGPQATKGQQLVDRFGLHQSLPEQPHPRRIAHRPVDPQAQETLEREPVLDLEFRRIVR